MQPPTDSNSPRAAAALVQIRRVWGFSTLRPFQHEAIGAALDRRDALVVLPTGGGKSLCYQAPPLVDGDMTVVISPLIALMKDQVDGLALNGYAAAGLHTGCSNDELERAKRALAAGEIHLLFVSPERLLSEGFTDWLGSVKQPSGRRGVIRFAIDEAHCISHWGHDFRPEYRRLATLRDRFPGACVHAFTATATERVRGDIAAQLGLREPEVLVGTFDRPNLTYRVVPRVDRDEQIAGVLARHDGDGAIVYCISRRDTEQVAASLRERGIQAEAYHAGLDPGRRRRIQDDFVRERLGVVVATVAFGMGIDRSDVRCVLHAAMPKSIEAYQQETGRGGRDGLPAECAMLYSGSDAQLWRRLFEASARESGSAPEVAAAQLGLLDEMQRFAIGMNCRHRALSEHFGQAYPSPGCGACDICLGEVDTVEDSLTVAKQIVSCVARIRNHSGCGFGAAHVVDVLRGSRAERVTGRGHDTLSTHGLLKDVPRPIVMSYVTQLIDEGVLAREAGQFPTLMLNDNSGALLRGERDVTLRRPRQPVERKRGRDHIDLADDERALFDTLRALRHGLADELNMPPYMVFSDDTLKEMSQVRPGSLAALSGIRGVGARKLSAFGGAFADRIASWCREHALELDARPGPASRPTRSAPSRPSPAKQRTFARFENGEGVESVAQAEQLAASTVHGHLAEWVESCAPADVSAWVAPDEYERIAAAAQEVGLDLLKPIRDRLGDETPYERIRVVAAHLRGTGAHPS